MTNIRDLIDQLEDLADEYGDHTEVRLAFQPRWPFEHSIGEVVAVELRERKETRPVVYVGEGQQLAYLPTKAAIALGWSEARDDEDDDAQKEEQS